MKHILFIAILIIIIIPLIILQYDFLTTIALALATVYMAIETKKSIISSQNIEINRIKNEKISLLSAFKEELEFIKKKYEEIINEPLIPSFDKNNNEEKIISLNNLPEENQDCLKVNPGFKIDLSFIPIFEQNIGKIGILDKEIVKKIIDLYQKIKEFNKKITNYNEAFQNEFNKIKKNNKIYENYDDAKLVFYNIANPQENTKEIYLRNINIEKLKELSQSPVKYITGKTTTYNKISCVEYNKEEISNIYCSLKELLQKLNIEYLSPNDSNTQQLINDFWQDFNASISRTTLQPPPELEFNNPIYPENYNDLYAFINKFSQKTSEIKRFQLLDGINDLIISLQNNINRLEKN